MSTLAEFVTAYERWDATPGDADRTRTMADALAAAAAEVGVSANTYARGLQATRRASPGVPPGPIVREHHATYTGGLT